VPNIVGNGVAVRVFVSLDSVIDLLTSGRYP